MDLRTRAQPYQPDPTSLLPSSHSFQHSLHHSAYQRPLAPTSQPCILGLYQEFLKFYQDSTRNLLGNQAFLGPHIYQDYTRPSQHRSQQVSLAWSPRNSQHGVLAWSIDSKEFLSELHSSGYELLELLQLVQLLELLKLQLVSLSIAVAKDFNRFLCFAQLSWIY